MLGQSHLSKSSGSPHKAKGENWGEDYAKMSHLLVPLARLSPDLESTFWPSLLFGFGRGSPLSITSFSLLWTKTPFSLLNSALMQGESGFLCHTACRVSIRPGKHHRKWVKERKAVIFFLISNTRFFFFKWQCPSRARSRRNVKNVQLETCEEQLDPPIVSNKNPREALGCPLGRWGSSSLTTWTPGLCLRSVQELVRFRWPRMACPWAS